MTRVVSDEWAMLVVGCGFMIFSAIQYFAGGVLINSGLWMSWIEREARPKKFWFIVGIEAITGLMLATVAFYRLNAGKF